MLPAFILLGCSGTTGDTASAPLSTLSTAEALAAQGIERFPAETMAFDWMQTVWGYGVHRVHVASGDPAWLDYYRTWMVASVEDFTGDAPREFTSSDSLSPAVLAATVMLEDPDTDLTPITDAAWSYLADVPTTGAGAIVHWGEDNAWGFPADQVWVDSQFMFGVFMLREHTRTGDRAALEQFVTQYRLFSEHCRDPDDALYRHAYDDATGENIPTEAVYWARGNSWVLISAAEALTIMSPDDALYAELADLFTAHAAATLAAQADDGLWHTVLGDPQADPDNYTETSAAALITYALALGVKAGVLDSAATMPAIVAAVEGVEGRIVEKSDGLVVEGTSMGTNPGDYDNYVQTAQVDDLILGLGAVVMMLAEVDGMIP